MSKRSLEELDNAPDEPTESPRKRQKSNEVPLVEPLSDEEEDLKRKYRQKQEENMALKRNLLDQMVGVSDESHFVNIEEFVTEYKVFTNQTHHNLLSALMDAVDDLLDDGTEDDDDEDVPDFQGIRSQCIAHQILHRVMMLCAEAMTARKQTFYGVVRELLHLDDTDDSKERVSRFVDVHLQSEWDTFIETAYYKPKMGRTQRTESNAKSKRQRPQRSTIGNSEFREMSVILSENRKLFEVFMCSQRGCQMEWRARKRVSDPF